MASSLEVVIHYVPSDGLEWARYIQQKLLEYNVICDLNDFTSDVTKQTSSAHANVFFLTPDFLDYSNWNMLAVMEKNSTMLVLTGIDHDDLDEAVTAHGCKHVLDSYIHELSNTEDSVRDFLILIIALYEDKSSHHTKLHASHSDPINCRPQKLSFGSVDDNWKSAKSYVTEEAAEDYEYDTLPYYARQVNGIKDVIYKEGTLYLMLDRRPENQLQVLQDNNLITAKHKEYAVYELQYTAHGTQTISVVQDSVKIGECTIDIGETQDENSTGVAKTHVTEYINNGTQTDNVSKYSDSDKLDDSTTDTVFSSSLDSTRESVYMNISEVTRSGSPTAGLTRSEIRRKNKLEKIRELLEDETDPLEMLCQCLGLDRDSQMLDDKMAEMIRSSETLRQLSYAGKPLSVQDADNAVWPTLVHFGAQFNMLNFCEVLLSNPLMFGACLQRNKDGHTPHDIAKLHGHVVLADHLRHFSEYVTHEKERDSGISGFSIGTPRLSAISQHPPTPHRMSDDGYIRMSKECQEEDLYENNMIDSNHALKPVPHDRPVFSGSYEEVVDGEDEDYIDMGHGAIDLNPHVSPVAKHHPSTTPDKVLTEPVMRPHPKSMMSSDNSHSHEPEYHRKDIESMLGMKQETSPSDKKKSKNFIDKMFRKKSRSNSEPAFAPDVLTAVKRSHKNKHRCESERSSGTSSTASTYSNSSLKDEEEKTVEMKGKKKATKKTKGFLTKAKKRESMRITHAKEDRCLQAPRLPPRRRGDEQEIF